MAATRISHAMVEALIAARSGTLRATGGRVQATNERGYPVRVRWPTVEALEGRGLLDREDAPAPGWAWGWTPTDAGREALREAVQR